MKAFFKTSWVVAAIAVALASCSGGNKSAEEQSDSSTLDTMSMKMDSSVADTSTYTMAHADLGGTKTDTVVSGSAHFEQKDGAVTLTLTLNVPKKAGSSVAVHFHEHGDCGNMGEGAHGHWNPTGEEHGKWGSKAYHSGDIGNVKLDKDGKARLVITSTRWSIGGSQPTNIVGRAIIVHSGEDDYKTQPTGNSGSRIGCGVISGGE